MQPSTSFSLPVFSCVTHGQNDMYVSDVSAVAHPLPLLPFITTPGAVFAALADMENPLPWLRKVDRGATQDALSVMWIDLQAFQSSLAIFSEW